MTDVRNMCWHSAGADWKQGRQRLWREHSDTINCSMLARWLPPGRVRFCLKTDLFDEMSSGGLFAFLSARTHRFVGIDVSGETLKIACVRHPTLMGIAADVRRLPFQREMFDLVVSNSTLDHFEGYDAIVESLAEIFRVLRPNGQVIITMDNLANPIIALRNAIPFRFLRCLNLTPYYVGATYGPRGLCGQLKQAGFRVIQTDAVLHCPRLVAVSASFLLERIGSRGLQRAFLRGLSCFELLRHLPTRFLTGYYVAVHAAKEPRHKLV